MQFPVELVPFVSRYELTGSTAILGQGADVDWLVKVNNLPEFQKHLAAVSPGWEQDGKSYANIGVGNINDRFVSFRKGEVNLIVTQDYTFYNRTSLATRVATALRLETKEDRITLFHMLRGTDFL